MDELSKDRKVFAVAALGDADGEAGPAALRAVISNGQSQDLICAAVVALAKRCGEAASPDLRQALSNRNGDVKDYALCALAAVGDDQAWDEVYDRLQILLSRPRRRHHGDISSSPVAAAICYLGRQLDPNHPGNRHAKVVTVVRKRWEYLQSDERQWLIEVWPGITPDGPPIQEIEIPEPIALQNWAYTPLFDKN